MKTAIIFATNHGCTEKCANELKHQIDNSELINLETNSQFDISSVNNIVIGGSIQAGRINKLISNFIDKNKNTLLDKKLGLFICCMDEDLAEKQFDNAYPIELREKAIAKGLFGGEFDFDKMTSFEGALIKKMTGIEKSISKINNKEIHDFSYKMNT